jgi:hypothetical protein
VNPPPPTRRHHPRLPATTLAAAALLFLSLPPSPAHADEIRLKDGTVVRGIINDVEADIISITPGYNADGSVKVFKFRLEDLLTFTTSEPIYVGTAAEESKTIDNVAYGRVEASPSGIRILTSTGTYSAPVSQVKSVYRTLAESPSSKELKKLERKWKVEITTDIRGKTGTSEQLGASLGFTAVNSGQYDSLTFQSKYNYYRTDGNKSADDLTAGIDYKSSFTDRLDRLLWYARTNNGFNKINKIEFFSESALGSGFMILNEKNHKLEFRVGVSYRYETYMDDVTPALNKSGLDAALYYRYDWSWGRFEDRMSYMPTFDEFSNYIFRHEAYLEFPIANTENLVIRLGVHNDYNSRPLAGVERLDTTYFTRIVLRF